MQTYYLKIIIVLFLPFNTVYLYLVFSLGPSVPSEMEVVIANILVSFLIAEGKVSMFHHKT